MLSAMMILRRTVSMLFGELPSIFDHHKPWLVITGAGISLNSGIPTYRDDNGDWRRCEPIRHYEFIQYEDMRKRYWARSAVGWPPVERAQPNDVHYALAELERRGYIAGLITQNVDRLHQRAGQENVIDLHGRLDRARCLQCGQYEDRRQVQVRLLERNSFLAPLAAELAPDGDAYVEDDMTERMILVNCLSCDGILMPDVVFFGGAVPKLTNLATAQLYAQSNGVLVVGSSLMVYSGFRFCKLAKQDGKPLMVINRGKTRADDIADYKIARDCRPVLSDLADHCALHPTIK
ncbi:NAD-dependent protein deacetylase, SIR2 family [Nitrosomonas sp. Nm51]|uniref:NAD-dependent protein deacetylase n=1 Tax=Nitrosomonas sp. Nm51 TaxID=133720 RepID=UPI0008CA209C|nr:NAD-dependent protein deacetylase [Nitrosomonas sp. Nm51]SER44924.1 NAD-dependent protein deacetylase, SIR2 family [Nitrosomonas sp. Nm51]